VKPFVLPTFDGIAPGTYVGGDGWTLVARTLRDCVAGTGKLDLLLQAVVQCAVDAIPRADMAILEMRSGDSTFLRAASGRSGAGANLIVGDQLSRLCLDERRPVLCADLLQDERVDRLACRRLGLRSIMAVPIVSNARGTALLKLGSAEHDAFVARDVDLAMLLAGSVAAALGGAEPGGGGAGGHYVASFHQAAVGIAHVSPEGRFLLVNDRFCQIAGRSRSAALKLILAELVHEEDRAALLGLLDSLLSGAIGSFEAEQRFVRPDGRPVWASFSMSLVRKAEGKPDFCVLVAEDVDDRKRAELEALHDPLTGLLNPRGLQERLDRELDRSANNGRPLTLAVLGLDGLPAVNEKLGAAEGDRCLQRVAQALVQTCRPGDPVARVGGDMFVLAMPGLDGKAAQAFLNRVAAAVAKLGKSAGWPIASRIGTASRPGDGATTASLIAAAAGRLSSDR
jgi:diguanylate cyclase (GGDEF)-like protein/PAS domain S-box-containing protein